MDMFEELQKIESLLDSARKLPGLGMMVDERQLKELVQNLGQAVPQEVRAAQKIIAEQENLINRAVTEGKQIAAAAEQELQSRINDSPVVKAASKRASEMLTAAQEEARGLLTEGDSESKRRHDETDRYADEVLHGLDAQLSSLAVSVRKGVALMESQVNPSNDIVRREKRH